MTDKRELEELELDVNAPKPLNKKQKRQLKKGLIEEPQPEDILAKNKPLPRSQYAAWIGNLSFGTTTDSLRQFVVESTASLAVPITAADITRIKLPAKKGFAYVDVKTAEQLEQLIKLSESRLDGRNLLIKNAGSFEGRPQEHADGQKNPPSRILFVGNLSFDTTDDQLEMHFQHCGEIVKIRTATFQDTGKCKGFTFIDFRNEEGAQNALKDASVRRMNGRSLRMEFGEDRSKRRPKIDGSSSSSDGTSTSTAPATSTESSTPAVTTSSGSSGSSASTGHGATAERRPRKEFKKVGKSRPTPGAALSGAMRAKTSVVPSTGKKMTFD